MVGMPTGCILADIKTIVPYAKNPKNHDKKDIDLIIKSIKRNGWGDPLLVCPETMEVLSGNGRLMAAKELGMEQVPVVYAPKGLTEKQKADLVIASNKLVEVSGYNDNFGALVEEFDLDISDFGMEFPVEIQPKDTDEEVKEVEKKLCQCPACGHINEEKAFRYHADSE